MKKPNVLKPILVGAIIASCTLPITGYEHLYESCMDTDYSYKAYTQMKEKVSDMEPVEADIIRIAQTVYGEARGCSKTQQAAVVWCILNRVDDPRWPDTVEEVVVPSQFHGYSVNQPVDPGIYALVLDVYAKYAREQAGEINVGRVLPKEYVFFHGDGNVNYFRTEYESNGAYWDWSLQSPYTEMEG